MKEAIASVEIFAHRRDEAVRRWTLVISAPRRVESGTDWRCRVALADLHRPLELTGPDSVDVLAQALAHARDWLDALEADGFALFRDRSGTHPYRRPEAMLHERCD